MYITVIYKGFNLINMNLISITLLNEIVILGLFYMVLMIFIFWLFMKWDKLKLIIAIVGYYDIWGYLILNLFK